MIINFPSPPDIFNPAFFFSLYRMMLLNFYYLRNTLRQFRFIIFYVFIDLGSDKTFLFNDSTLKSWRNIHFGSCLERLTRINNNKRKYTLVFLFLNEKKNYENLTSVMIYLNPFTFVFGLNSGWPLMWD